jgi:hypothetical protein
VKEKCCSVLHVAISVLRKIRRRAYEYEVVLLVLAVEVAATLPGSIRLGRRVFY